MHNWPSSLTEKSRLPWLTITNLTTKCATDDCR